MGHRKSKMGSVARAAWALGLGALLVGSGAAVGQTAPAGPAVCADFEAAIESSLKTIAMSSASLVGDNSAARATNGNIENGNRLQMIAINLQLQIQNKCPVRKAPIVESAYFAEALSCKVSQMKGEKDSPLCEQKVWTGVLKKQ